MESDGNVVTAKNTYAGPLLLRTVLGDSETTYQYMYNAHGDVVTLLTDGEVVATYYYDAFGNILEQTGDVDNSILYAGYQYDVETGLYYLNARMYDPVTARFLQADTYLGNLNDPLSLNLYTYCLNNPNRYIDPSGHIPALLLFLAGRALIGLGAALLSAGMEIINQKFIEKRTRIDYDLVKFEAISNGMIAMITSGLVNPATLKMGQGGVAAVKTMAKLAAVGAGIGFAEGFTNSVGRQMVMGTRMEDISYSQALDSGITGGLFGIGGEIAGYGLEALKRTRVITNMRNSVSGKVSYYANIMKGKFDDVAGKASKVVELGDVAYQSGSNSRNILNVGAGDSPIPCATNIDINPSATGVIFGDANDLSQFASGQFDHVIALNPYKYNLLDSDVPRVLKEGGIMSVTGNYSNKYFKSIYNASPEVLRQAGFEVVSRGDAGSAFLKYGGKVTGGVRQTQGTPLQIILRKVGAQ